MKCIHLWRDRLCFFCKRRGFRSYCCLHKKMFKSILLNRSKERKWAETERKTHKTFKQRKNVAATIIIEWSNWTKRPAIHLHIKTTWSSCDFNRYNVFFSFEIPWKCLSVEIVVEHKINGVNGKTEWSTLSIGVMCFNYINLSLCQGRVSERLSN